MNILSMDIGGSKILLAKFHNGKLVQRSQEPTHAHRGREYLLERILSMIQTMKKDVEKLILLIPGVVYENSYVVSCGNLPLREMNLKKYMEEKTGIPTLIGNDVSLALFGEWKMTFPEKNNLLGLFVGSGLGGGMILHGKLYTGQGAAGEVGHLNYVPQGRPCSCGSFGCYEAYAAKSGMRTRMEEARKEGRKSLLFSLTRKGEILDSRHLHRAVEEKDSLALELVNTSAIALGHAISMLHILLEPDVLLLGGGLIEDLGENYLKEIEQQALTYMMPAMQNSFHLSKGKLGGDAGIYGGYFFAEEGN